MPLSDINILLLLENASSRKSSQVFEVIRQNLTNSDRINDVKLKGIQDKNYSSAEFHKILQRYGNILEAKIRDSKRNKANVRQPTKE